ncbi:MAG: bifunctional hydroxymethylpyrimidine kinase/phosphomethylpyrimidine kinase [Terriglobales bacterium]
MHPSPPTVLSIAGYDPSSGAGVTADIKTIAAHGCYGVTCITALTVQSTTGVRRVQPLTGRLVSETLDVLAADLDLGGVRVGMLGSREVAQAVADFLEQHRPKHVVLDPILRSSSGAELLDERGIDVLRKRLLRLAEVVTPNLDEAAVLAGVPVRNVEEMRAAARKLHEIGAAAVVITGGHLPDPVDLLSVAGEQVEFAGQRLESKATHGTGCAFATALACNLARAFELKDAVRASGEYVRQAIANAYAIGKGKGPVNHLYGLRER